MRGGGTHRFRIQRVIAWFRSPTGYSTENSEEPVIIAELLPAKRIEAVLDECEQLCRILGKSVATAKGKRRKNDESGGDAGRS